MSGKIDTPVAIPAPLPARTSRTALDRPRTVWLSEPIDLRQAVERLQLEAGPEARPHGTGPAPEEIARRLRDPRAAR